MDASRADEPGLYGSYNTSGQVVEGNYSADSLNIPAVVPREDVPTLVAADTPQHVLPDQKSYSQLQNTRQLTGD